MHSFKQRVRSLACAAGIFATALLSACGGGDQGRDPILGVPAAPLLSVTVTPATASVAMGVTQQFVATATYADGASRDITTEATFSSGTPAVATVVTNTGLARGVTVGTANINASFGGRTGTAVLTVTPAVLVSMQIAPVNPSITVGAVQQFTTVGTFSDNTTRDISATTTFSSATPAVATINPTTGQARGVAPGTSVITATSAGRTSSTTLTVTPAVLVALSIAPVNPTIQIGANQQLFVSARYSDGSVINVTNSSTFISATSAVAGVNSAGLATGASAGTSVATASFNGMSASTTITVPAATLTSIAVTPATAAVVVGGSQQFTATGTFSDGSTGNITNSVLWTSSNTLVAQVLQNGVATGLTPGVANITATRGAVSGVAVLTVNAAPVPPVPPVPPAPATINLRSADTFAVLSGTTLTSAAAGTTFITGDIGASIQSTTPPQAPGFSNFRTGLPLTQALADLQLAIIDANSPSRPCTVTEPGAIDLGGRTLSPGVYCFGGAINLTNTLSLSGPGLFIFRINGALNTAANSRVQLLNGATAANVFFVPTGETTLGANSVFQGSILSSTAPISVGDNTTLLNGRVLSGGAVTLVNNQIRAK